MTTSYWLECTKCGTELLHGMEPPPRPAQSCTARDIRMNCRRNGCDPQLKTKHTPLELLDQVRLGLVDEQQAWAAMKATTPNEKHEGRGE